MMDDLRAELAAVPTRPLLSWVDEDGYPATSRVDVHIDDGASVVRLDVPAGATPAPGPASLFKHVHDEKLWNMKNVLFRGVLARTDDGWTFEPRAKVGSARLGALAMLGFMRQTQKVAYRYLDKRGLGRPPIDWPAIRRIKKKARELGLD